LGRGEEGGEREMTWGKGKKEEMKGDKRGGKGEGNERNFVVVIFPQRDATIFTRIKAAAEYPRITARTKHYQSFLSYALSNFQAT